jgi:hypothetical protein
MKITSIKALRVYITQNSNFSKNTINNVIRALGYPLTGSGEIFSELSTEFENCAEYGANIGIPGFTYCSDTKAFFKANRQDIVNHMEITATELGTDIISMVQNFGVFRNSEKPTVGEIGKALWGSSQSSPEFTSLYNVFAWYALEEVSNTWYRYLEDNPGYMAELSA